MKKLRMRTSMLKLLKFASLIGDTKVLDGFLFSLLT
jgi:hypothetical protein